jgi:hypothetical protein
LHLNKRGRAAGCFIVSILFISLTITALALFSRRPPCCFQKTCTEIALEEGRYLHAHCKTQSGPVAAQWNSLDLDDVLGIESGGILDFSES